MKGLRLRKLCLSCCGRDENRKFDNLMFGIEELKEKRSVGCGTQGDVFLEGDLARSGVISSINIKNTIFTESREVQTEDNYSTNLEFLKSQLEISKNQIVLEKEKFNKERRKTREELEGLKEVVSEKNKSLKGKNEKINTLDSIKQMLGKSRDLIATQSSILGNEREELKRVKIEKKKQERKFVETKEEMEQKIESLKTEMKEEVRILNLLIDEKSKTNKRLEKKVMKLEEKKNSMEKKEKTMKVEEEDKEENLMNQKKRIRELEELVEQKSGSEKELLDKIKRYQNRGRMWERKRIVALKEVKRAKQSFSTSNLLKDYKPPNKRK